MNAQDIFNQVATHLFKQGQQSKAIIADPYWTPGSGFDQMREMCAYRGEAGLACAVGCLIPDEAYRPEIEGLPVESLMDPNSTVHLPSLDLLKEHRRLLGVLQDAHDNDGAWISTGNLRAYLADIAARFDLDAAILDTLSFADR